MTIKQDHDKFSTSHDFIYWGVFGYSFIIMVKFDLSWLILANV